MTDPIIVTKDQYYAIGFAFFMVCMMYTALNMFSIPHEEDEEDEYF